MNSLLSTQWMAVNTVAIIGECMLELSAFDGGNDNQKALGYGGDTLNTAVYLAGAGCVDKLSYFTALGDDIHSDAMISQWQSRGIDCDTVQRVPGRLPGLYMIETDDTGERHFYYWRDQSPARDLFEHEVQAKELFERLAHYDLIYFSGVTLSLYSEVALARLLEFLSHYRQRGGLVAFDSNYRPQRWPDKPRSQVLFKSFYRQLDVALPTLEDEQLLFELPDAQSLYSALSEFGVKEVVIKEGDKGCLLGTDGALQHVAAQSVEKVVDTTGAGDAFNAGYLVGRLKGESMQDAARRGHSYGAQVVAQRGAIVNLDY